MVAPAPLGAVGRATLVMLAIGIIGALAAGQALAVKASHGPTELHVAPWGKDHWPGTAKRPFATLQRAQQSVRARTPGMRSDIVVNLHPGTHELSTPLRLRDAAGDSGENGHRVVYRAYRRGRVTVSGGRTVTRWRLDDKARNVWRADVGDLETRQLFVDGVRAKRAALELAPGDDWPVAIPGEVAATNTGYVTDSAAPKGWSGAEDIEFVWDGHRSTFNFWSEPRCGVAGISGGAAASTITMDQPCFRWVLRNFSAPGADAGLPTRVENSKTFLTEPGEFYLDRSRRGRHVLFYIPRRGEDLRRAHVVVPTLERLVEGAGTPGAPLHDVTFRGLTFSYATWLAPSKPTGFVHTFGPIYEGGDLGEDPNDPFDVSDEARTIPGNVAFRHARRIVLEGNRFTHLGAEALELSLGSSDNLVVGNVFNDVSSGAIEVGNRQPYTELDRQNADNTVANNLIQRVGLEYSGGVGISAEQVQGVTIAHNQVSDTSYTGITFGEFWTHYPPGETTGHSNRIVDNRIFETMQVKHDGGGIWTVGPQGTSFQDGSVVSGNIIHDTAPAPVFGFQLGFGLFPDDGSRFVTFAENVIYRTGWGAIGGCLPLGPLRLTGNYWDNPEPVWVDCAAGDQAEVELSANTLVDGDPGQACEAIPECAAIAENAGLEPGYRHLLAANPR